MTGRGSFLVVAAAFALSWSRPLSPFIAVGIIGVGVWSVATVPRLQAATRSRAVRLAALGAIISIASAMVWIVATDALGSFIAYPDPALTTGTAALQSWRMTWYRLEQMVGLLGWLDTPLPDVLWWTWGVMAVGFGVAAVILGTARQRLLLVGFALGAVLLPVAAEALTAARMGFVWQGRYTLPVAVGFVLLAGRVLGMNQDAGREKGARQVVVGMAVAVGISHVVAHMASMARYSTGYDLPLWDYLLRPGWAAPLPDVVLLGMVLMAGGGVVILVLFGGPAEEDQDRLPLPDQDVMAGR